MACRLLATVALAAAGAASAQPAKGLNELGVIAFQAKDFALAIEHFEKARDLDPENPSVRRNLCAAHQGLANDMAESGEVEAALAQVEKGLAEDPKNSAALAQAGAYSLTLGKAAEAEPRLRAALEALPTNDNARFLLGEAYYQQNKLKEAREAWEPLLDSESEWPGLREKYNKLMRESGVEQAFKAHSGEHFQLSYDKVLSEETRAEVLAVLEEAYKTVGERLGGLYPADTVQVVLYDGEQFAEATGTKAHVGALFDGKIRAPITSRKGRFLTRRVLESRLTHEYVHVVLAAHLGKQAPWWLNEGLAETFSREMDGSRERILGTGYRAGAAKPFSALEQVDLNSAEREELALAYAQTHAAVNFLWRRDGAKAMAALIKALQAGKTPEEALQTAYGMNYAELESAVAEAYQ